MAKKKHFTEDKEKADFSSGKKRNKIGNNPFFIDLDKRRGAGVIIDLPRLKISAANYIFLVVFAVMGFLGSKSMYLYASNYRQVLLDYQFSGLPAFLLMLACAIFTVFSILTATTHSKSYNSNITNVFEYMKRQNKTKFGYKLNNPPYEMKNGVVNLLEIKDSDETGEPVIVAKDVPRAFDSPNKKMETHHFKISDINEVSLTNQNRLPNEEPDFIKKNDKIKEMIKSDRQQLIAFVAAYLFSMSFGFFAGLFF